MRGREPTPRGDHQKGVSGWETAAPRPRRERLSEANLGQPIRGLPEGAARRRETRTLRESRPRPRRDRDIAAVVDDADRGHAQYVGRRIRRLRLERGLSQQRLADLVGIDRSHVADWEAGRYPPSAALSDRIGAALDVRWWELYARSPVEPEAPTGWRRYIYSRRSGT